MRKCILVFSGVWKKDKCAAGDHSFLKSHLAYVVFKSNNNEIKPSLYLWICCSIKFARGKGKMKYRYRVSKPKDIQSFSIQSEEKLVNQPT